MYPDDLHGNAYTNAPPDSRVMIGSAVFDDHNREVQSTEGLPQDIQKRIWRMRIIQSFMLMLGLVLLTALLLLFRR
jgi:hypothetical protein